MLTVHNLTKRYGNFTVLDQINLELENGVYGLIAPNGAGKTTLIKLLTTLSFPTDGEILWNGTNIIELGERYREVVGYLPQAFGYYRDQTPVQYLKYLAALKGLNPRTVHRTIDDLLEMVALKDVAGKKMKKLSGGMIQRVGIAQAFLNNPKILMLDEPTAGLDPKERVRFRRMISAYSKDRIIILSTHIVSDVESIANKIIMIKDHVISHNDTADRVCSSLKGEVFEVVLPDIQLEAFEQRHFILSQKQEGNKVTVRFINDGRDVPEAIPVSPNLEDVFLYINR